jgi:hypothetical protein
LQIISCRLAGHRWISPDAKYLIPERKRGTRMIAVTAQRTMGLVGAAPCRCAQGQRAAHRVRARLQLSEPFGMGSIAPSCRGTGEVTALAKYELDAELVPQVA